MNFSRASSDGMIVSGDFTLLTPRAVLSPESIQILTQNMSENLSVNVLETQTVMFHGVHKINSPKENLNCCYTYQYGTKIQPGDIVAICPLGWKRLREIVFYIPAEMHYYDKWISMFTVTFEADNLPKDCAQYEFCYISSGNVLGCSTPFTFFSSSESDISVLSEGDYIAVEDPHDPGLVVFKSRGTKSTEDLSKYLVDGTAENFTDSSNVNDNSQHLPQNENSVNGADENLSDPSSVNDKTQHLSQNEIIDSALSVNFENLNVEEAKDEGEKQSQHENNLVKSVNSVSSAEVGQNETQDGQQPEEISTKMSASDDKAESTFEKEINNADSLQSFHSSITNTKVTNSFIADFLTESVPSSITSTISTNSFVMDCSYDAEVESSLNASVSSLPELIGKLSLSPEGSQVKSQELNNNNTLSVPKEPEVINDTQHPESRDDMKCSMRSSNTSTSTHSEVPPNLTQQNTASLSVSKEEFASADKDDKSDNVSNSHSASEINISVPSASVVKDNENIELQERVRELKETNAYLKSRVSVLELELRTLNEDKYGILLKCIESYENENSSLKDELDKHTKVGCEMESLKFKCDRLAEENSELRKFITSCPSAFSLGGNKVLMLENNMLKAKCQQLEHKISDLNFVIQEEKAAQGLKSCRSVRQVILNQGHELAFMRSECREISEKLKTLIDMFESMNIKTEDYLAVTSSLSELQSKCALVIQRNQEKSKLFEVNSENREEKQKLLAKIESLRKEICDVQKQNLELKEQLISLRKQCVGKVSLQFLQK